MTVRFLEAVDRGDVRVVQRRKEFGFALKPRQAIRIVGEGFGKNLMATSRFSRVSRAR